MPHKGPPSAGRTAAAAGADCAKERAQDTTPAPNAQTDLPPLLLAFMALDAAALTGLPKEWTRYTYQGRSYSGQCYPAAFRYVLAHRGIEGIRFAVGSCWACGGHAWVELPGDIVFEATHQQFYPGPAWRQCYRPVEVTRYTPEEAYRAADRWDLVGFGYSRFVRQYRGRFPEEVGT